MIVRCYNPDGGSPKRRSHPAYLLKGEPADARLVVRFFDEDRVVSAAEARHLQVRFGEEATDEELYLLHEGGYSIVD